MRVHLSAVVAVVSLLATAVVAQSPQTTEERFSQIAGTVRDASGNVLPGVTVEVAGSAVAEKSRSVTTDSRGLYRFTNLPAGSYSIRFSLTGFWTELREGIVLIMGFTAPVNVRMELGRESELLGLSADRGTLKGTVRDDRGFAITGVVVTLTGPERRATTTDRNGDFTIENLPLGAYEVRAALDGFATTVRKVTILRGGITSINLEIFLGRVRIVI